MATDLNRQLVGVWQLESADAALKMDDDVEMEFRQDGELIYAIDAGSKWQIMRLRYRVEAQCLITDQPSSPREERTEFHIDDRGALVLNYAGANATYVRGPKRSPDV